MDKVKDFRQYLLLYASYTSVTLFILFFAAVLLTVLVVVASSLSGLPIVTEGFFDAVFATLSFILDAGSTAVVVMFAYCMIGISKNKALSSSQRSNWRWFLIINWVFAIPEYFETFRVDGSFCHLQKVRKWLRPSSLMFLKP